MSLLDQARALDAADPLRGFRDRFDLPEGVVYLDGNSLGALPKATKARLADVVQREWGEDLIRSWNSNDWIGMPQRIGGKIAPLIGAAPHEVIACDSVSVNLAKLIGGALAMRPDRNVVLSEPGNFPTDLYMVQGDTRAEQRLADRDAMIGRARWLGGAADADACALQDRRDVRYVRPDCRRARGGCAGAVGLVA